MSEYQYHEWQTVDRLLTPTEQAAVNRLSSHIKVNSRQAVVTYQWSDFRYDPKKVLLDYFDGYFYLANWGSLRLMFRFPKGMLTQSEIERYCLQETITFETIDKYQVLDLDFNPEEGGGWMEPEAELSYFIQLRADLMEGDYRLLYLAWLNAVTIDGAPENYNEYDPEDAVDNTDDSERPIYEYEPPIPPGLKKLSPSLENFIQVFGIDPFLVQAAAEKSPDFKDTPAIDYQELIGRLPRAECDEFLTRLAEGDLGIGASLRKRLGAFLPKERLQSSNPRTIQQLIQRAEQLEKAEKERQTKAAHHKYILEMKNLAAREELVWQQIDTIIANGGKIASVYNEATGLLDKLKQLSDFQNTNGKFVLRISQLAQKYASRPSLIARWKDRGWV
jgi:hypothetical protein